MVQILPEVPSFASLLARDLGAGLSKGVSQASQFAQQSALKEKELSRIEKLLGSSTERQGQTSAADQLTSTQSREMNLTPEKVLAISQINPKLGSVLSNLYKVQEKKAENQRSESQLKNTAQESFNGMAEILNSGDVGIGANVRKFSPTKKGEKVAESVGEFQSLSGGLESILVDMVSRGTLSKSRFEYITEYLLPQAGDREATIKGKLKGLAKELGLDPSALGGKEGKRSSDKVVRMTKDGVEYDIPAHLASKAKEQGFS